MAASNHNDRRFTEYHRWLKALRETKQEMPSGFQWWLFALICRTIAEHGNYGTNCYVGNKPIAHEVRANVDTVRKYKQLIMHLGWFEYTGERVKRAKVIRVSIPSYTMPLADIPADVLTLYGAKRSKRSQALSEPSRASSVPTPTSLDDAPWEVDSSSTSRPTQTVSEPSSGIVAASSSTEHVGSDMDTMDDCPVCEPRLAKWRASGHSQEMFDRIVTAHESNR